VRPRSLRALARWSLARNDSDSRSVMAVFRSGATGLGLTLLLRPWHPRDIPQLLDELFHRDDNLASCRVAQKSG
jgi:hypothetical protein